MTRNKSGGGYEVWTCGNNAWGQLGEGSIIYSIGHHRFIEMARAAGATYKINEGTGGTVLINLEVFDEYMEQFRQSAVPMKHPLFVEKKEGE
jgi:hypothetical protein